MIAIKSVLQPPPSDTAAGLCLIKERGSVSALNKALAAHTNIKKGEEERECAREKIELNSLILNYYLSIMGGGRGEDGAAVLWRERIREDLWALQGPVLPSASPQLPGAPQPAPAQLV